MQTHIHACEIDRMPPSPGKKWLVVDRQTGVVCSAHDSFAAKSRPQLTGKCERSETRERVHEPKSREAMECASHLGVMRVDELIDAELYGRGIELLERNVAMFTKLIDP